MKQLPYVDLVATGQRIKKLRKERNLRVEDISEYLGFTTGQAVYKWQKGACLPDINNLLALSQILEVSMEDILVVYGEGDEPSPLDYSRTA